MKQEYPIELLEPGMFVAEVLKQNGKLKIKSQGLVRTSKSITDLTNKGVLSVLVDLSKSKIKDKESELNNDDVPSEQTVDKTGNTVKFEQEINTASNLYQQAKDIQTNTFNNFKAEHTIDVNQVQNATDNLIDSVFRNHDALACVTRMRAKDQYLMEHSINVSILMSLFGKHLGLDNDVIQSLATGAMLQDLGMIAINDKILNKSSALTDNERLTVQQHVTLGLSVLERSKGLSDISLDVVANHHERLDGSGYPNQLQGDQISQYARMAAIVDSYDAITAERNFKGAKTPISAFKILQKEAGVTLDKSLVAEFIKCMGIHPVGTLVQMKSNKLAIVVQSNKLEPLSPVVNVFYSVNAKSHTEPKVLNLASNKVTDEIERSVKPEDFKIDMLRFFKQVLLN